MQNRIQSNLIKKNTYKPFLSGRNFILESIKKTRIINYSKLTTETKIYKGFLSLQPLLRTSILFRPQILSIQIRTMKTGKDTFSKMVQENPSALSNFETSIINFIEDLVLTVDPTAVKLMTPVEQEIQVCSFIIKHVLKPQTELITQLDIAKSFLKKKDFKKTAIIEAFRRNGIDVEDHMHIMAKGNKTSYHFIGELSVIHNFRNQKAVHHSIHGIKVLNENNIHSPYAYQVRQDNCDIEMILREGNELIMRGADIKIGNIKNENISTIMPMIYDENTDYLTGILNNIQPASTFLLKRIALLEEISVNMKNTISDNILKEHIACLKNKSISFTTKMEENNIFGLQISGTMAKEKLNGIFNPSYFNVTTHSFKETGHRTLAKYPNAFNTMKDRKFFYYRCLVENDKRDLLEALSHFKGTAFEPYLADLVDITFNLSII